MFVCIYCIASHYAIFLCLYIPVLLHMWDVTAVKGRETITGIATKEGLRGVKGC